MAIAAGDVRIHPVMTASTFVWVVAIIAVLAILIVFVTTLLLAKSRQEYKRAEITLVDRSLSHLPDESSYELWREAADQSQAVSDQRRRRRRG